MKSFCLFLLFLLPVFFAFTPAATLSCDPPANISTTYIDGGSVSFDWDGCTCGCSSYGVRYIRQQDNYAGQEVQTTDSGLVISGLVSGTYDFYFVTICGGVRSAEIVVEEVIVN